MKSSPNVTNRMKLTEQDIDLYSPYLKECFPEANLSKVRVYSCRAVKIPYYLYNRCCQRKCKMDDLVAGFALGNRVFISEPYPTTKPSAFTKHLLLHELTHCCQFQKLGYWKFFKRHSRELRTHGFAGMYVTPGTLEYEAEEVARNIRRASKPLTTNRAEFSALIGRLAST